MYFRCLGKNGFHVKAENEDLPLQASVVVRTSKMKISRRRLTEYVRRLRQRACRACSTIIFLVQPIKALIRGVVVVVAVVTA